MLSRPVSVFEILVRKSKGILAFIRPYDGLIVSVKPRMSGGNSRVYN